MITPTRLSYGVLALTIILAGLLHLGTPLLVVLFAYFALRQLFYLAKRRWLALILFVVIRPVSVLAALAGARCSRRELRLMSWFGIRGIGSLYYLMYVVEAGTPVALTDKLVSLVLTVVAASIAVHGISATLVMAHCKKRAAR